MEASQTQALRRYCLADVLASTALLRDLPEVSGAITKTYDFKVRVTLPLNRHTEGLLAARTGSMEQRAFLREMSQSGQLDTGGTPLTVVALHLNEAACRMFRREGSVVVLLHLQLSYSAHRAYRGQELQGSLKWRCRGTRYGERDMRIDMLSNQ